MSNRMTGRELAEVAGLLAALGFVAVMFSELSRRLTARVVRRTR